MKFYTESREMTGVVLGGGRGTRLHPLTAETSKHLLPIGDKPMVSRTIEQLLGAGIKDIVLLIDQRYASQFMDTLQDGSILGARSLAYVWQDPEGKGLPSAINRAAPHVGGKFVVACGDVLIEKSIKQPVSDFSEQKVGARVLSAYVEDSAGYSPLVTQDGLITEVLDKDALRHQAGKIDLGVYMYPPDVFNRIKDLQPSARGETEIWELNRDYINDGMLCYSEVDGWWSDAGGSIGSYLEAYEHYA